MSDENTRENNSSENVERLRDEWRKAKDDGWWEERSLPQKILLGIGFAILGVGFLFLIGFVVRALWNWLMPEIFGLQEINYWQAWGLFLLSTILFKNWGSGGEGGKKERRRKRRLKRYMENDVEEETER